ncbi:MAG: prenyltransferase [Micrococcales bacterium]
MPRGLFKQLFMASRPVSWVNTAYPFAFTYFVLAQRIDLNLIVGTLFFLIPYNLLMYGVNDVFDYESDLRNPRKGSIEGAILDKKWHRPTLLWAFLLPLPFVVYLFVQGNLFANFWLIVFLFAVVAYSAKYLRFKEIPFLDSITSASHFVGPAVFAIALVDVSLIVDPAIVKAIFAFMLWGMASHAFGAVQDIKADREGGLKSIATSLGAANTTRFAFFCYALAAVLLLLAGLPYAVAAIAALPYLLITAPYLKLRDADCEKANRGWRKFIWLNFFAGWLVTMLPFWF